MARPLLFLVLAGCSSEGGSSGSSSGSWTSSGTTRSYGESDADTDSDTDSDTDADTDADDSGSPSGTEPICDEETPVTLYISPDDSNSMSSPVQARLAILDDWSAVSTVPIRTHEFMNYYGFDYPSPEEGSLQITNTLAENGDGTWTLQVGITAAARRNADRAPMNVTLSVDTSGSMEGTSLDLARETAIALGSSLREGDIVSLASWSNSNEVLLEGHAVSGPDDPELLQAIEGLAASGSTNLFSGLSAAYNLAEANQSSSRINRVILISDGGANVGVTEEELIGRYAGANDEDGIYLVGVGVGTATTYNDTLMDTATDLGRGASLFIGEPDEAWKMFGDLGVVRTLDVAWRSVSISIDLPPGFEIVRFSGEEVSTNPHDIEPQHLAPDDSMVFYMTLSSCAPGGVSDDSELLVTASYADPLTLERSETTVTSRFGDLLAADQRLLRKGAAVYSYAQALEAWQGAGSDVERGDAMAIALERVERAMTADPDDEELVEIWTVLHVLE